jgi:hypothetical protein
MYSHLVKTWLEKNKAFNYNLTIFNGNRRKHRVSCGLLIGGNGVV